jgi:hypothetical protein
MRRLAFMAAVLLSGCTAGQLASSPYGPALKGVGLIPKDTSVSLSPTTGLCVGGLDLPAHQLQDECDNLQAERKREIAEADAKKREQDEAKQKAIRLDEDRRAVIAQQHPSHQLLERERVEAPLWRYRALVIMVGSCGLRSPFWQKSLNDSITMAMMDAHNKLPPVQSQDESFALSAANNKAYQAAMKEYPIANMQESCVRLLHSDDLSRLDRLQVEVTGNYH